MGVDITVLIVDWTYLAAVPVGERLALLEDMAWPEDDLDFPDAYNSSEPVWGWECVPDRQNP